MQHMLSRKAISFLKESRIGQISLKDEDYVVGTICWGVRQNKKEN